jgi:hypothetical protein
MTRPATVQSSAPPATTPGARFVLGTHGHGETA